MVIDGAFDLCLKIILQLCCSQNRPCSVSRHGSYHRFSLRTKCCNRLSVVWLLQRSSRRWFPSIGLYAIGWWTVWCGASEWREAAKCAVCWRGGVVNWRRVERKWRRRKCKSIDGSIDKHTSVRVGLHSTRAALSRRRGRHVIHSYTAVTPRWKLPDCSADCTADV